MSDDARSDTRNPDASAPSGPPRPGNPTESDPSKPDIRQTWTPEPGPGLLIGGVLFLVALLITTISLTQTLSASGLSQAVWIILLVNALAVAACSVVAIRGIYNLRYILGPEGLVISGLWKPLTIPYTDIVNVTYRIRDRIDLGRYEALWPGYRIARLESWEGVWQSFATVPPNRRVRIRTRSNLIYAISPERPVLFQQALDDMRFSSVPQEVPAIAVADVPTIDSKPPGRSFNPPPILNRALIMPIKQSLRFIQSEIGDDRAASELVAAGVIGVLLMGLYALYNLDGVSQPVPIHWDAHQQPDRWVTGSGPWVLEGLWIFPFAAALILIVNLAFATLVAGFDRYLARVLIASTTLIQLLIFIAMLRVTL